jgi:hypothetical protein
MLVILLTGGTKKRQQRNVDAAIAQTRFALNGDVR